MSSAQSYDHGNHVENTKVKYGGNQEVQSAFKQKRDVCQGDVTTKQTNGIKHITQKGKTCAGNGGDDVHLRP
jgi:hypothetical protein